MASIEMQLDSLAQLFDSLDPAPFHDKSLDRDAEAWLIESVDEISSRSPLELVIRGPDVATLDNLRETLAAMALQVELTSVNPGSGGVEGRLRIKADRA